MDPDTKSTILDKIYSIYDEFAADLDTACKIRCAHCCTRNVTLTTLEAYKITDFLQSSGKTGLIDKIEAESGGERYKPAMTTNEMAELCAKGEDPPEEDIDSSSEKCPLLTDDECPVYEVRPFACRCFMSRKNCGETGFADPDDFAVSVNTALMQYIEHFDAGGFFGNLTDIVLLMAKPENRDRYRFGTLGKKIGDGFALNHPLKILMVPPEHREIVMPVLMKIQAIQIPGGG